MRPVYMSSAGRRVLSFRVPILLDFDEMTSVLSRAIVHEIDDVDEYDFTTLTQSKAARLVRDELAFGGYEAYGHLWDENVSGDTDLFFDRVKDRVGELFPALVPEAK